MINKKLAYYTLHCFLALFVMTLPAKANCILIAEGDNILFQQGECTSRHAPCSTFKIALSLMGFQEGYLQDEEHPKLGYKPGYANDLERWRQPHTPQQWIKNSCVWYSQLLTEELGMEKFQSYVTAFSYGNKDVSGDKERHNGLTQSWLSSSLEIAPEEQLSFLHNLLADQLPVSEEAHQKTRDLLYIDDYIEGWRLYGKTGSGYQLAEDRITKRKDRQIGWFVGWVQKGKRKVRFVHFIQDEQKEERYASQRARESMLRQLKDYL